MGSVEDSIWNPQERFAKCTQINLNEKIISFMSHHILSTSALVIVKPLPKETYLKPGKDLNMSITIFADISGEEDVSISLGHSSRGVYQNLTEHLVYDLYEVAADEDEGEEENEAGKMWNVDMTLPYPHSQASGDISLSVKDRHSGDFTTTQLIIRQEGKDRAPFFDPVPKSVETKTSEDALVDTRVRGSKPIKVGIFIYLCNNLYVHESMIETFFLKI